MSPYQSEVGYSMREIHSCKHTFVQLVWKKGYLVMEEDTDLCLALD